VAPTVSEDEVNVMTTSSTNDPSATLPFGPVLLGQTEKTLQALLRRTLRGTGLSESEWVTLRLAVMLDGAVDHAGLVAAVIDRARFADTAAIVDTLIQRGYVADGRPTATGREVVADVLAASDRANGSVWRDLPSSDVEAAARVLNEVLRRARQLVA
jgi:hypothetical protein